MPVPHSQNVPRSPHMRRDGFDYMRGASVDPPVTKESLSELDLNRIVSDARLRHDLNFEHEIMFRPNTYGVRGLRKKQEEDQYFEALAIEIDYYLTRHKSYPMSPSRQSSIPMAGMRGPVFPLEAARRLSRMLASIRDIVKILVPAAKWQAVDDQFDTDLRMQELEHGICNIAALIEWLGKLLLCSCSPMRDPLVKAMMAKTQSAIESNDVPQLVDAIKDLFAVLETMKLDVANHQIRYLRLYLLEDSIQYEQNQILDRIAAGWSISHERRWFEIGYDHPENEDGFLMFKARVINMIVSHTRGFPSTFTGDHDRLYALQHDFRLCHYHAACVATFRTTLQRLGWKGHLSFQSQVQCMQNIWAVIAGLGEDFKFSTHRAVILQIASEALKVCGKAAVPDYETQAVATRSLQQALDEAGAVKSRVWDELARVVHIEAEIIFDMTPLGILNRYDPGPPIPGEDTRTKELSLDALAKRAAHVIVLHWRVWAPILYNQPAPGTVTPVASATATPEEEMAGRRRQRGSTSSVKVSRPAISPGHGGRHRSKSVSFSSGSDLSQTSEHASAAEYSAEDIAGRQAKRPSL
ncbi:MAG: hypothetical protein LQ346_002137 [Caloplaca aetnensis]|nr:MAG: hypothetical protein LQ346_002137 [Caloplaca aetnensis]